MLLYVQSTYSVHTVHILYKQSTYKVHTRAFCTFYVHTLYRLKHWCTYIVHTLYIAGIASLWWFFEGMLIPQMDSWLAEALQVISMLRVRCQGRWPWSEFDAKDADPDLHHDKRMNLAVEDGARRIYPDEKLKCVWYMFVPVITSIDLVCTLYIPSTNQVY